MVVKRILAILLAALMVFGSAVAEGTDQLSELSYAVAWNAVRRGDYAEAAACFASLGEYEDSEELAYLLGVSAYAEEMTPIGGNVIAYAFHGQWGLINLDEKVLIAPEWSSIGPLNTLGLAMVSVVDYYGYVNAVGTTVIPCEWRGISGFSGNLCTVMTSSGGAHYGLMDATGAVVTPAIWIELGASRNGYTYAPVFTNERIVVRDEYGYGIMDAGGNLLGNAEWSDAPDLTQTYPIVRKYSLYGFINLDGQVIVPVQYKRAFNFSEGLAAVMTTDMLWQYIDPTGAVIIPPVYADAQSFSGGVAHVRLPGMHWQIIDTQGRLVYFLTAQVRADYEAAVALMAAEDYEGAADLLENTIGYEDSYTMLMEANRLAPLKAAYDMGMTLVAADQPGEALPYLAAATGYKDADDQFAAAQSALYERGKAFMAAEAYTEAADCFAYIPDYLDAAAMAAEATRLIPIKYAYDTAMNLLAGGQVVDALAYLGYAAGFKDADEQLLAAKEAIYQLAVDSIADGHYADALALLKNIYGYKDVEAKICEVNEQLPNAEYRVESVGTYGFVINDDGYFESTNQGVPNSYAMCTVTFVSPTGYVYIDYINRGQVRKDYGLISVLDGTLLQTPRADTVNVLLDMSTRSSPKVQTLCIEVPADEPHRLTFKYIKDGSGNQFNDSLQFRLRFE